MKTVHVTLYGLKKKKGFCGCDYAKYIEMGILS